jgi:hypothetical protein
LGGFCDIEADSTGSRLIRGAGEVLDRFIECWEGLDDPRSGNAAPHDFREILAIAMCAALCGGQGSVDMGLFAKAKEPVLRGFLRLENGVPSHDTFSRPFRMLEPEQFRAAFQPFMAGFSEQCERVVAIDGKVLRRSFDSPSGKSPLHMVSACAASNASCWRRSPPTRSQAKSPTRRSYWRC